MEIEYIQKSNPFFGEDRIIIRKLKDSEYKSILKLLKNLGLKRDRTTEKFFKKASLNGYKKLIGSEIKDKKEFNKKIKEYKKELKKSKLDEGVFESKEHNFQFAHSIYKGNTLAGSWKSKKFNADEFFSLILSNK